MKSITLKKENWIKIIIGAFILLTGFLVFLTIIGILPGFGLMIIGYMLMCDNVNCPECKTANFVPLATKSFCCKTCKKVFLIKRSK